MGGSRPGGGAIVAATPLAKPFLSAESAERNAAFGRLVPVTTRLL
ncbi:MAG TPA: hypothetical protein VIP46_13960 [Pyrinomonadaceae bacterium]